MTESRRQVWVQYAAVIGVMLGFALVWQMFVYFRDLPPILLPSPVRVAQTAWKEKLTLVSGFLVTGAAASLGLAASGIVGFGMAILFSQSRMVRTAFYPYVIFLQTVPIVAIAPLLITWCGYGFNTVVLVAAIISLFPIVSNVTAGLLAIDDNLRDLFELHAATRMQLLLKLRIPAALDNLVLGLRISTGLAVIGAVVGEFFVGPGSSGYKGLGSVMIVWQNRGRTDALIAAILVSTLLGLCMLAITNTSTGLLLKRWLKPQA